MLLIDIGQARKDRARLGGRAVGRGIRGMGTKSNVFAREMAMPIKPEDHLFSLEEKFWTEGADFYRQNLAYVRRRPVASSICRACVALSAVSSTRNECLRLVNADRLPADTDIDALASGIGFDWLLAPQLVEERRPFASRDLAHAQCGA